MSLIRVMTFLLTAVVSIVIICDGLSLKEDARAQGIISNCLNASQFGTNTIRLRTQRRTNSSSSSIRKLCSHMAVKSEQERVGCCYPSDQRYLYNIMFKGQKIIFFAPKGKKGINLPPVKSLNMHKTSPFTMTVTITDEPFVRSACKSYFNGTLHIFGLSTSHNPYHMIGDNIAPLISQILWDHFFDPEFLHLPRLSLEGFKPPVMKALPHFRLLQSLTSAGSIGVNRLDGMCFKRVVWGNGAHVLYYDTIATMRRLVGDFSHCWVKKLLQLQIPPEFHTEIGSAQGRRLSLSSSASRRKADTKPASSPHVLKPSHKRNNAKASSASTIPAAVSTVSTAPVVCGFNASDKFPALNIVIFSRGDSGRGRSMQGEELLRQALAKCWGRRVRAVLFNGYETVPLEQQISYAAHADVIMGLHGAALAHGLFMKRGGVILELKTLYGYQSGLFPLIADARVGIAAQIDIRKYFVPGGTKPMDQALINRVLRTLEAVVKFMQSGGSTSGKFFRVPGSSSLLGDYISGTDLIDSRSSTEERILGPYLTDLRNSCAGSTLYRFRAQALGSPNEQLHCSSCATFNSRRRLLWEELEAQV